MNTEISFTDLAAAAPHVGDVVDAPCPLCSGSAAHQPRRKVFRIWRRETGYATYCCARCGARGWSSDRSARRTQQRTRISQQQQTAEGLANEAKDRTARLATAVRLWKSAAPLSRSPGERYLREARGYSGPLPATLRFLPARQDYPPAIIAAFGLPSEPEPGVLELADSSIKGVHLTRLKADGSGKADLGENASAKIMLGSSSGFPIALAPPNDGLGLAIAEGVEDALSIHEATGLGAWAAGSAGRLPKLADKVPAFIDAVTIAAHPDFDGERGARALADALVKRGIEVFIEGLSS